MTTKDLNLSLDRGLFKPRMVKGQQPQARAPGAASGPPAAEQTPPRRQPRSAKPAARPRASRQWLAVSCVLVANMLFLLLAALWLSGNTYYATSSYATAPAAVSPEIATSLTGISERLNTLELQLENLQLSLDQQQLPIEPEDLAVDEQLPETAAEKDDTVVTDSGEAASAPAKPWHVNLGNFDTREAAVAIQHRLAAIGHRAEISAPSVEGNSAYLVILPGFSDRESAEFAATQIMSQTELNGLWLGKGN